MVAQGDWCIWCERELQRYILILDGVEGERRRKQDGVGRTMGGQEELYALDFVSETPEIRHEKESNTTFFSKTELCLRMTFILRR